MGLQMVERKVEFLQFQADYWGKEGWKCVSEGLRSGWERQKIGQEG